MLLPLAGVEYGFGGAEYGFGGAGYGSGGGTFPAFLWKGILSPPPFRTFAPRLSDVTNLIVSKEKLFCHQVRISIPRTARGRVQYAVYISPNAMY
jgi:hypothetical protein